MGVTRGGQAGNACKLFFYSYIFGRFSSRRVVLVAASLHVLSGLFCEI